MLMLVYLKQQIYCLFFLTFGGTLFGLLKQQIQDISRFTKLYFGVTQVALIIQ